MPEIKAIRVIAVAVGACLAACAHQPPAAATAGLETRMFPFFVFDPTESPRSGFAVRRGYRACAAVYVAPHLLVTSAAAFPDAGADRLYDPGDGRLVDGSFARDATRLMVDGLPPGLALLRTREAGETMDVRTLPVGRGDRLTRVGFRFQHDRGALVARAGWDFAEATALTGSLSGGSFQAETTLQPGACGAALLDEDGRLAGLVVAGNQKRAVVVDGAAILDAVRASEARR